MNLTDYNTMSEVEINNLKNEFISEITKFAEDNDYVLEKMLSYYTKIPELNYLKNNNSYEQFKLLYIKETILKKYKEYETLTKKIKKYHIDLSLLEKIVAFEGNNFNSLSELLDDKNITLKDLQNNYLSEYPITLYNIDFSIKKENIDYKEEYQKRIDSYMKFVNNDKKKFNKLMDKLNNYAGSLLLSIIDYFDYESLLLIINNYRENELVYIVNILNENKITLQDLINNIKLTNRMDILYANNNQEFNDKFAFKFKNYIMDEANFEKQLKYLCKNNQLYEKCIKKLAYDGGKKILYEGLYRGFNINDIYDLFSGKLSMSFDNINIMYKLIDLGYYDILDIKNNLSLNKPLKIPLQQNIDSCSDLDKVLLAKRIDNYQNILNQKLNISIGGR